MEELSYRQIHLDFHTSPVIPKVGADFDPVEFTATLKKAGVESINIFAKCHHGMCYYPTKVGRVHPGLKRDLLGEMITALHAEGIKAPIYFPIGWEEVAAENLNWLEVNADGVLGGKDPFCAEVNRWRDLCLNKDSYLEFIFEQVSEIISLYPVDGFWFDIISQHGCVCADCQKSMKSLGLSPQNPEDVSKHDLIVVTRFMKKLYTFVKDNCPEALVFFNGDLAPDNGYDRESGMNERAKYLTHIEIESLPSETWGYNHFPLYVNYHNRKNAQIIGMNGKFHNVWGDFGSLRNLEALEYECFRMIMNGSKICIGDQMHPRGVLDKDVYERIGQVYAQIEEREPWCRASKKQADIGIFMVNGPTDKDFTPNEGALRMMLELHHQFDFIDCEDDLQKYKLLILPDNARIDSKIAEKISAYLKQGGKLIASCRSGFDADSQEFIIKELGVEYIETNPYIPSYIVLEDSFRGDLPALEYAMYQESVSVKAIAGTQILAQEGRPYFNRSYDRFCSHRHFPFECLTGNASIVRNGNVIYIANQVFSEYIELGARLNRDIIEKCINLLLDAPLMRTNLPSSAEVTYRTQQDKTIVHILHYIAEKKSRRMTVVDTRLPLIDIQMQIRCEKVPQRVYLAPTMEELHFEYKDGYVFVEVPKLVGHGMVVME
ncbi:MAG: hypothetical protein E7287_00805 [Lachnospiraceae bacterium]|nr:hypothetical protein [Lachnospiraceae bacterium]